MNNTSLHAAQSHAHCLNYILVRYPVQAGLFLVNFEEQPDLILFHHIINIDHPFFFCHAFLDQFCSSHQFVVLVIWLTIYLGNQG